MINMNEHLQSVVMTSPINIPDGYYDGYWYGSAVYFKTPAGCYVGQYQCGSNESVVEITVEAKNNRFKIVPREIN